MHFDHLCPFARRSLPPSRSICPTSRLSTSPIPDRLLLILGLLALMITSMLFSLSMFIASAREDWGWKEQYDLDTMTQDMLTEIEKKLKKEGQL